MARSRLPPGSDRELLYEFCVRGVALSAQTKNRERLRAWQVKVAVEARAAAAGAILDLGPIAIQLSEFSEVRSRDRDNVAKPIQDALQGIIFGNDSQVAALGSDWYDINGQYRVRYMSRALAAALTEGSEFVWIRIYRHRAPEALTP